MLTALVAIFLQASAIYPDDIAAVDEYRACVIITAMSHQSSGESVETIYLASLSECRKQRNLAQLKVAVNQLERDKERSLPLEELSLAKTDEIMTSADERIKQDVAATLLKMRAK